jgi:hypothetical protein
MVDCSVVALGERTRWKMDAGSEEKLWAVCHMKRLIAPRLSNTSRFALGLAASRLGGVVGFAEEGLAADAAR